LLYDSLSNFDELAHVLITIGRQTDAGPLHRRVWFAASIMLVVMAIILSGVWWFAWMQGWI
jgi:hypothetical protein